jgi:hypothetical protein
MPRQRPADPDAVVKLILMVLSSTHVDDETAMTVLLRAMSLPSPDLVPVQKRLRTFSAQFHDFRLVRAQIPAA